ncbi:MAG: protein YhfH [Bacillota bacterium]|nr:protein YhfH [Bacillota bacterium]
MMNLDFYHNLPQKKCCTCGCEMEEMHESYFDECEHCLTKHDE